MAKYELDPELVLRLIDEPSPGNALAVVDQLAAQLAIPTEPGAVVWTEHGPFELESCGLHWRKTAGDPEWVHTDKLPRITKVISDGSLTR